jgi:pyridoxine 5-phosphate synthase
LGVNVDHVATVRQARGTNEPDPVTAAALAELAGAEGITVHLREDRRHIQDRDVEILCQTVQSRLNLEMAATDEMVAIALRLRPDCVTLVPEKRQELTTEGGLDVIANANGIAAFVERMHKAGVLVSLFVDADAAQVRTSREVGAQAIEINTGPYAEAPPSSAAHELARIAEAARAGAAEKLEVLAGHGLDYVNVVGITTIPEIVELNIGHSIVSRASLVGMDRAVRDMVALLT